MASNPLFVVALLAVSLSAAGSVTVAGNGPCNNDEDCNLNGECVLGQHSHSIWDVEDNENAVWGRSINCGGKPEDKTISLLGALVHSTDDCWSLCNSSAFPCHGFAYHHLDHPNKACAGGCYGLRDDVYQPHAEAKASSGKGPRYYNGTCKCRAGWTGETCGLLDLDDMAPNAPPAYGQIPSASTTGVSTWGGSVIHDPNDPHVWHMFAAEMALGCGLNAWGRNSVIVHATSTDPMGPYVRQKELLPYFAHEPTIVQLPPSSGGGFVIYKIGCADGAITGSNGTGLVGPCTCCHNGTTNPKCNCPAPTQSYERVCQDVLHSHTLDGPWDRVNLSMPDWDWRDLNLGLESMAPVVLDNGTVLTLTRSWGTPAPYPNSAFWLVRGSAWNGTYAKVDPAVAAQPFLPVTMEDSFMYRDEVGHFHALFHIWDPTEGKVGAHAFSRDGLYWQLSPLRAYTTRVNATDGSAIVYGRRERPHLILDRNRRPTHLISAVQYGPLPRDFSHTHIQAIVVGR